jgi:hypothetical protein
MNQELVDRSLAYVAELRSHPIQLGMELDHETLEALATRMPENRDIKALFASNNGMLTTFFSDIRCDRCGIMQKRAVSKTQLISYIEHLRRVLLNAGTKNYMTVATCAACKQTAKTESALKDRDAKRVSAEKTKDVTRIYTEILLTRFLHPKIRPYGSLTWKVFEKSLKEFVSNCYEQELAAAIKAMDYNLFLQTPYWIVISFIVKRDAGFRCAMCDSKDELRVHHKNYKLHGYEHTREGRDALVCVCDNCHAKHHGKHENE